MVPALTPLRPPLAAVAVLSGAALAYEVLLLRLFAIVQWHHFAYLAISVALLGIGAAGTFVTLARRPLLGRYPGSFALAAAAFGLTAIGCFALAARIPFNALELAWDPAQLLGLAGIYLLLFVPFFCAATALCIAYARFGGDIPRLYGADILGAGLGSLALLAALFALQPPEALRGILALGLAAAALALRPTAPRNGVLLLAGALALPWLLPATLLAPPPSDYKELRQALRMKQARVVAERWSPLGVVTAVESPVAPPRHAPGLALTAASGPPEQIALFIDGQAAGAVTRFDGRLEPLAYLRATTAALPYALLQRPRVLVLGSGAGGEVLQALVHGAARIDAVELDPQVVAVVEQDLGDFSGRPYAAPAVRLHVAEARGFVAADSGAYDLIQLALLDTQASSAAGLGALNAGHLYTVEAFGDYLARLAPGGLLAVTRWVALPPRDTLRLLATAIAALERRGSRAPAASLALIRSWNTATLLVKNGAFQPAEIAAIRDFASGHGFDLASLPGAPPLTAAEANRYNLLERDDFFDGTRALLGPAREDFIDRYKFAIAPASDDRPYFFHFFKWNTLPEFWRLRAQGALPPLDWGYPVLVLALAQATALSLLLILLPLATGPTRRAFAQAPPRLRRRTAIYFLALGLGFMAIEIPFLQVFGLFLSHPAYAAAVVLAAFLAFAGLGARHSRRLHPDARWPFVAIALLAVLYVVVLPPLLAAAMALPQSAKVLLTVALVAPLAFCLGMPFPLGLAAVARASADTDAPLLPWAWGINGFASVVAALGATLLSIHFGHAAVVLSAAVLYAIAASQFPSHA